MNEEPRKKEYRIRIDPLGECHIDYGIYEWRRIDTLGRAVTQQEAATIVAELNTVMDGTNAKLRTT